MLKYCYSFIIVMRTLIIFCFILLGLNGCNQSIENPNILWLTCEDISPMLSCSGDSTAKTPVLDQLAKESMVFTNVHATVGVCAPARSSIITGMFPVSIGTMQMRTGLDVSGWGKRDYSTPSEAIDINGDTVPLYSAVLPEQVKCFTEYLRVNGYYCTNNAKTDYQFAAPITAWDENGNSAHWRKKPDDKPFFSIFNHTVTHESQIWARQDKPLTINPEKVPIPVYFPDNEVVRTDLARCYSNIEVLDQQLGKKIQELKDAGEYENTIIFFFSDHGGPLPRGKRELYDSGLKVPFLVRFPNGEHAGRYHELLSFVDLAPTVLSLAGIKAPDYMQGNAFLGMFRSKTQRKYIYGTSDRFDEFTDRSRMVKDSQFMYVRNYYPDKPRYKDVAYRKQMPIMRNLLELKDSSYLDSIQNIWFSNTKSVEELYDCHIDPYQVNNLITKYQYSDKLEELRNVLDSIQTRIGDMGCESELEMFNLMWPNGIQPVTKTPELRINGDYCNLSCSTNGSSIAYMLSDSLFVPDLDSGWKLYSDKLKYNKTKYIYAVACRIGYKDSEVLIHETNTGINVK